MTRRPVALPTICGTSRPHLHVAKPSHVRPHRSRPGGPPVEGVDLNVIAGAVCAEVDPELFFSDTAAGIATAKAVCQSCPVRIECLDRALANDEKFGVFGGLDAKERAELTKGVAA